MNDGRPPNPFYKTMRLEIRIKFKMPEWKNEKQFRREDQQDLIFTYLDAIKLQDLKIFDKGIVGELLRDIERRFLE